MATANAYADQSQIVGYASEAASGDGLVELPGFEASRVIYTGGQPSGAIEVDIFGRLLATWRARAPVSVEVAAVLQELQDVLERWVVAPADAASSLTPQNLLSGQIAHWLISADLVLKPQNGLLIPDVSLSNLLEESTSRRRPDLARLLTREFWEIKTETTIGAGGEREQLEAYGQLLRAGERLASLASAQRLDVKLVPGFEFVIDYEHHSAGLIGYSTSFDIGDLLKRLARKLVDETIKRLQQEFKELKASSLNAKLVAVMVALAVVIIIGSLPPVAGAMVGAAARVTALLVATPQLIRLAF